MGIAECIGSQELPRKNGSNEISLFPFHRDWSCETGRMFDKRLPTTIICHFAWFRIVLGIMFPRRAFHFSRTSIIHHVSDFILSNVTSWVLNPPRFCKLESCKILSGLILSYLEIFTIRLSDAIFKIRRMLLVLFAQIAAVQFRSCDWYCVPVCYDQ